MLFIDPNHCIDCGACVPACPVEAIFDEGSLPEEEQHWLMLNAQRAPQLPVIRTRQEPLGSALSRARAFGFTPHSDD